MFFAAEATASEFKSSSPVSQKLSVIMICSDEEDVHPSLKLQCISERDESAIELLY